MGNVILASYIRPEFWPSTAPADGSCRTTDLGIIDAPNLLPAGAMTKAKTVFGYEYWAQEYAFRG